MKTERRISWINGVEYAYQLCLEQWEALQGSKQKSLRTEMQRRIALRRYLADVLLPTLREGEKGAPIVELMKFNIDEFGQGRWSE